MYKVSRILQFRYCIYKTVVFLVKTFSRIINIKLYMFVYTVLSFKTVRTFYSKGESSYMIKYVNVDGSGAGEGAVR